MSLYHDTMEVNIDTAIHYNHADVFAIIIVQPNTDNLGD